MTEENYQVFFTQMSPSYLKQGSTWINGILPKYFEAKVFERIDSNGKQIMIDYDENRLQYLGTSFLPTIENTDWFKHLEKKLYEQLNLIDDNLQIVFWFVICSKPHGKKTRHAFRLPN